VRKDLLFKLFQHSRNIRRCTQRLFEFPGELLLFFSLPLFPSAPKSTIGFRFSFLFVVFRNYATSVSLILLCFRPEHLAVHFPRFLERQVKKEAVI